MKIKTKKSFKNNYYFLYSFLFLLSLIFLFPPQALARNFSPHALPVGSIVKVNGEEFIKVTSTGKFVKTSIWNKAGQNTMQGWDGCASLLKPTGTGFTQGPILIDMRDNKTYEIRKFSDGQCWMVDNLMYGGDTDACNGKSTFNGNGSATPSHQFGPGTYGDCLDPRVRNKAPCTTNSTTCGYFYNWQAIMQHPDAYYGGSYTGSGMNVKGLCPDGWRLPTYNDFITLHTLASSPAMGFWQTPGNWKGVFAGLNSGSFIGTEAIYWSSTPYNYNIGTVYGIHVPSTYAVSINNYIISINNGFNVRCLRN